MKGNFFLQNKDSMFALLIASGVVGVLFLFLRRKNPEADNLSPFFALLTISSFVTGIMFLRNLLVEPAIPLAVATAVFTLAPVVFNYAAALLVISREKSVNQNFAGWLQQNIGFAGIIMFLSGLGIELLQLMSCGVMNLELTNAPFSKEADKQIKLLGLGKWLLGDMGMFGVQLAVAVQQGRDKRDPITFLGLWLSGLLLVHGLTSRWLVWIVGRKEHREDNRSSYFTVDSQKDIRAIRMITQNALAMPAQPSPVSSTLSRMKS